jgi:hypothetical protein
VASCSNVHDKLTPGLLALIIETEQLPRYIKKNTVNQRLLQYSTVSNAVWTNHIQNKSANSDGINLYARELQRLIKNK